MNPHSKSLSTFNNTGELRGFCGADHEDTIFWDVKQYNYSAKRKPWSPSVGRLLRRPKESGAITKMQN
jgi:hypothetical protein